LPQPDRFICISYSNLDFLIPNDEVFSAVSLKEFDVEQMCGSLTGIYNLDDIAKYFNEKPLEKNIHTMVMLKKTGGTQVSFVTNSECRVCKIKLDDFGLFSNYYSSRLAHLGIQACSFEEKRIRYLLDIRKIIDYLNVPEEEI